MSTSVLEIDYRGVGATVSQVQVLASVIKAMMQENEMLTDLDSFVNLPIPKAFKDWQGMFDFIHEHSYRQSFYICSEETTKVFFFVGQEDGILDYSIYRSQALLQKKLKLLLSADLYKMSASDILRFTDSLKGIYISLCNGLGDFVRCHFFEDYDFSLNAKPLLVDIEWLRRLTGQAQFYALLHNESQRKHFEHIFRTEFVELSTQCRYLSFWICLLQFIFSPSLPEKVSQGFFRFVFCLLQKHI